MIILIIGILLLLYALISMKKELRKFSNAMLLLYGMIFSCVGIFQFWKYLYPGITKQSNGEFILNRSGEYQSFVIVILIILFVIFGIYLVIDGIKLIKRERICLAHILPILLGILYISLPSILILDIYMNSFMYSSNLYPIVHFFINLIYYIDLYIPICFFGYIIYSYVYMYLSKKNKKDINFILVLGARICGENVSPLLAKRLDKAIDIYKQNLNKPLIIVSGGQGKDEVISEALAMKRYLLSKGISEDNIILEDKSTSTYENMIFSKKIMDDISSGKYYCLFSTNNFHVLRSAILARSIGLNADGVGCKTAKYYLSAAAIRETIAFIFRYKYMFFIYLIIASIYIIL